MMSGNTAMDDRIVKQELCKSSTVVEKNSRITTSSLSIIFYSSYIEIFMSKDVTLIYN
jgi:hypothetical protein